MNDKVFYQDTFTEVPVRENTKALCEAESDRDVRYKLADRKYNIEFIQPVSEDLLELEKSKENYKVENI